MKRVEVFVLSEKAEWARARSRIEVIYVNTDEYVARIRLNPLNPSG